VLAASTTSRLVVANDPAAPGWFPGESVIADDASGHGPLAGIATALRVADGRPVIVLAWDMPFVSPELLIELRRRGSAGVDAVVPLHGGQREPLCAWYAADAAAVCRRLLESGERRAVALAENLPRVAWLEDADLAALGDPQRMFTSVDTPDALAALGGAYP